MNTPGGFGECIRVPASWCAIKPPNHDLRYFMVLGTAGLTAGLSVDRLMNAVQPNDGDVLVTGASGGVGSLAIALLAKLGFQTVALTSKVDHSDMLASIGTHRVLDRSLLESSADKPLLTERWAGVVDTVGGPLFSKALRAISYGGAATTCGMVSGTDLNTSMFPFILRGITLFGIDSVGISNADKQAIWDKLDDQWSLPNLQKVVQEISLEELPAAIEKIYCGKMLGRVVLKHRI
jgi:alcohol dehydrogenase